MAGAVYKRTNLPMHVILEEMEEHNGINKLGNINCDLGCDTMWS